MNEIDPSKLRRGWTTGACATAAVKAALTLLWGGEAPREITIVLPRGETPSFVVNDTSVGGNYAEASIEKDAGDDPDVTHGAIIRARVQKSEGGVVFKAGEGVGVVTKPGLPIGVGEPAINPVPRQMITSVISEMADFYGQNEDVTVTISVENGAALALKTWNPRLGIEGGLSILGTTGIVRPFSCSAWIASIHRGIDVARADGLTHVAGCTGATSERVVQEALGLPDHAMLDMGDFAGGLLKYLAKHPIDRLSIGGGIGKLTKLAQGARDLHSKRSQVDFSILNQWSDELDLPDVSGANTALHAYELAGKPLVQVIANKACEAAQIIVKDAAISIDCIVIDRAGKILARST
jgi:cobalt-precorrin-5B (C1)-methyltransferase